MTLITGERPGRNVLGTDGRANLRADLVREIPSRKKGRANPASIQRQSKPSKKSTGFFDQITSHIADTAGKTGGQGGTASW
jgi:hypothetical protein